MSTQLEEYRLCSNKSIANKIPVGSNSPKSVEHNGIHLDALKTKHLAKKGPRSSALFNIMVFYLLETFDGAHQT